MHQFKKIVQIPFDPSERRLEVIKNSLERSVLLHPQVISNFQNELAKIARGTHTTPLIKSQAKRKELIQQLHGRCHHLKVRRAVIDLAEDAEKLVHNKDNKSLRQIQTHAKKLQNKIDNFNHMHRTSRINAKFLRFANNCLQKARQKRPLLEGQKNEKIVEIKNFELKEVTKEDYQLAQDLYMLAQAVYSNKLKQFKSMFEKLDIGAQKELHFHVHRCKGSLSEPEIKRDCKNTIRGILGYAHTLTDYYTSNSAYPCDQEILQIFDDLNTL